MSVTPIATKKCRICGKAKRVTAFSLNGKSPGGVDHRCKACNAARQRAFRISNPEQVATRQRRASLKKRYGISFEMYDALLQKQKGVCAGCLSPCSTGKQLAVDHDHATGVVRGLLCTRCNRALGCAQDQPVILRNLAHYLEVRRV